MANLKDFVLLIDKPEGITSFKAVAKVKNILGVKKVGHAGTLDKAASGLLVLGVNQATKIIHYLFADDKKYKGVIKLGIETDSDDCNGKIIRQKSTSGITEDKIVKALDKFKGETWQKPPSFSALKIKGSRASDLMRKGESVDLKERKVKIYSFSDLNFNLSKGEFAFEVFCSKGTYIRSLARDLGEELGIGAHLAKLRRIESGSFKVEEAVTLSVLEENYGPGKQEGSYFLSAGQALSTFGSLVVKDEVLEKIMNGVIFTEKDVVTCQPKSNLRFKIFSRAASLLALAEVNFKDWQVNYLNVFRDNLS